MKMRVQLISRLIVLGLLMSLWPALVPANAQGGTIWSPPKRIPNYNNQLRAPLLVADQNRTVHAFDIEVSASDRGAIVYRRWTLAKGWTNSVDVIDTGARTGPLEIIGVVLDQQGRFHLVYYRGTQTAGSLYYTWAYAIDAAQASNWSTPRSIADNAGPVAAGDLAANSQDKLVAVFGGQADGIGLYEVHSTDAGQSWSDPVPLSIATAPDTWPVAIWLAPDEAGNVHVTWHLANNLGQGLDIRYARLWPDDAQWEHETVIAKRDTELELVGWASIIAVEGKLIVAYQDGFPPTRWVRQSTDNGQSWADPIRPFQHIGGYEYIALVSDSVGTVHMVMGNRIASPEIHGMWHSQLTNNIWTPLVPITSGPSTATFDPCCAQAVMSQGNVLLATWPHNVRQENLTGAWYSYLQLNTPELPIVPLAGPSGASQASQPAVTAGAAATQPTAPTAIGPTPTTDLPTDVAPNNNPTAPLYVAVVPVLLLVVTLIVVRQTRGRR